MKRRIDASDERALEQFAKSDELLRLSRLGKPAPTYPMTGRTLRSSDMVRR
ncbi:hypothetical protein [Bradyrhizobium elkanii]|jgi:hypothetical protein|uniref:hypothetical protein n=1 Tax=Bradyrhizobium elkanii TaxID=29448 RepID=UPI00216A1FA3|nr:hypothetical protein [Bradyrhizobium elkanii]